jgi:hypothetical protein
MDAETILDLVRDVGEAVLDPSDSHSLTHLLAAVGAAGLGALQARLDKRFVADLVVIRDA